MSKIGFGKLLLEIQNKVSSLKDPSLIISTLFTLDGKINKITGNKSLNIEQIVLYQNLNEFNCTVVFASDFKNINKDSKNNVYFGITEYGRLILGKDNFYDEYTYILGCFIVKDSIIKVINDKIRKSKEKEDMLYKEQLIPFFENKNRTEINEILKFIKFNIYHMAPILLYLNDQTFSTFYNYNNLVEEFDGDTNEFLLNDLLIKNINDWKQSEKIFVFNMYLLLKSGPPSRGEEVNGIHFSLSFLNEYFDQKIQEYSDILQIKTNNDCRIEEKAQLTYVMRTEIEDKFLIYRLINGINLHKEEKYIEKNELSKISDEYLKKDLEQLTNVEFSIDFYHFFYQIIENNLYSQPFKIIDKIMNIIINKAISKTSSDIGMARGFRSPLKFHEAHQNDELEEIFNWKQNEYFCCVVPSANMKKAFQSNTKVLIGILTAISKRMEYNSWHYTPGNFLNNQTRITRHFYFPPAMADITQWSDQHHKGHMFAKVRHAIRCPGSISNEGYIYNAFFDLRLMKQFGKSYSEYDLAVAMYYQEILKQLFQAWLDVCKKAKTDIKNDIYKREWYQQEYINI